MQARAQNEMPIKQRAGLAEEREQIVAHLAKTSLILKYRRPICHRRFLRPWR
jgi:hypothetical protein